MSETESGTETGSKKDGPNIFMLVQAIGVRYSKRFAASDDGGAAEAPSILEQLQDLLGDYGLMEVGPWHHDMTHEGDTQRGIGYKFLSLPERTIDGYGEETLITKNHFAMQIFRVPLLSEPTVNSVVEVALYCGLLTGQMRMSDFPEGYARAFWNLGINAPSTFVNTERLQSVVSKIPTDVLERLSYV